MKNDHDQNKEFESRSGSEFHTDVLLEAILEKLSPNKGIIGIDHKGQVFEGYDGSLEEVENKCPDHLWDEVNIQDWKDSQLTADERRVLGPEMIRRWQEYLKGTYPKDHRIHSSNH